MLHSPQAQDVDVSPGRFMRHAASARWVTSEGVEGLLVWNRRSGRSVRLEWNAEAGVYVRAAQRFQLPRVDGFDVRMAPFVAPDRSDVVLTWDATTGRSCCYFLDPDAGEFVPCGASYQVPACLDLVPPVLMAPGVTPDRAELIRVWSETTGVTRHFVHSQDDECFRERAAPPSKGGRPPRERRSRTRRPRPPVPVVFAV